MIESKDNNRMTTEETIAFAPFRISDVANNNTDELLRLVVEARQAPSGTKILSVCLGVARFLIRKNAAYGNSALNPVRVFSKASAEEQILVRLDDKLSRLARGSAAGEDVLLDIVGYIVLLIAQRQQEPVDIDP